MTTHWKTGVYCWINVSNGKRYIGSAAQSLRKRLQDYSCGFRQGRCHNPCLIRARRKYGPESLVFLILERCPPEQCVEREQYWIDYYRSADPKFGYNLCPTAGNMLGMKMSPETVARKSVLMKARYQSNPDMLRSAIEASKGSESRVARSLALKGNCSKTVEHRAKLSMALTGRKVPADIVEKTAAKRRGVARPAEVRVKLSVALVGNTNGSGRAGKKYGPNLRYRADPEAVARKRKSAIKGWAKRRDNSQ